MSQEGQIHRSRVAVSDGAIATSLAMSRYDTARGLAADRDKFVGAMKIEQADCTEPRVDENVRRIAGEARARNPALRDIERIHHRYPYPWRAVLPFAEESAQIAAHPAKDARFQRGSHCGRAQVILFKRRLYRDTIVDDRSREKSCRLRD